MEQKKDDKWLEVLDYLTFELPKRHKNLYAATSEADYLEQIRLLRDKLDMLETPQIKVEIARIVASVGDAHTSVDFPVYYLCPLEFYWFSDGIHVVNAAKTDEVLRYQKITHIDGMAMETVIEKMGTVISHENQSYLKSMLPKYLPAIELLFGLGIVGSVRGLTISYENQNGDRGEWFVRSCPFAEYRDQLEANRMSFPAERLPLFRKHQDRHYWMDYLADEKTLYFNYNRCKEMDDEPIDAFGQRLLELLDEKQAEMLVVDMRNNTGGNSTLLDGFIARLSQCQRINQPGKLFVIIGRDTFSSALLNVYSFKNHTQAVLVGEPTGGKPNCYGEVVHVRLEPSGLVINHSTKYYHLIEDDRMPSLFPDVEIEHAIEDYVNLADPCMEYIKSLANH